MDDKEFALISKLVEIEDAGDECSFTVLVAAFCGLLRHRIDKSAGDDLEQQKVCMVALEAAEYIVRRCKEMQKERLVCIPT